MLKTLLHRLQLLPHRLQLLLPHRQLSKAYLYFRRRLK
jgi:hypothetical protein